MLSAYVTALPSSSVLPAGGTFVATVDGGVVVLVLACAAATLAAALIARRRHRDVDAHPSVATFDRDAAPPPRKLSAA